MHPNGVAIDGAILQFLLFFAILFWFWLGNPSTDDQEQVSTHTVPSRTARTPCLVNPHTKTLQCERAILLFSLYLFYEKNLHSKGMFKFYCFMSYLLILYYELTYGQNKQIILVYYDAKWANIIIGPDINGPLSTHFTRFSWCNKHETIFKILFRR